MKILWITLWALLWLLGALLAVMAVFLLVPARVRAKWDGQLTLWAGAGPVTLRLMPLKAKKKPQKKRPALDEKPDATPADAQTPKLKLDLDTIVAYAKIGFKALGRVLRAIRISRLQLHAVIAAENPSTAAMAYGGAAAAVNSVVPLIEKNVVWRNADIFIEVDFNGKADVSFDITVSMLPIVAVVAGIKLFFAYKKINKSKSLERVK